MRHRSRGIGGVGLVALVLPELLAVPIAIASGTNPVLKVVYPLAAATGLSLLLTPALLALRRRRFGWCLFFALVAAGLGTLTIYGALVIPGAAVLAAAASVGALRQGLSGERARPGAWAALPLRRRVAETTWASWKSCYLSYRMVAGIALTEAVVLAAAAVDPLYLDLIPIPVLVLLWTLADWSAVVVVRQSADVSTAGEA